MPSGEASAVRARSAVPKTVVVIDDELDSVDLTVLVLQSAGHKAIGATEGRAGFHLAVDHAAQVVVLDHLMPGLNGAEVGQALRSHAVTRSVKILMHSGLPEEAIRSAFEHYDAYLLKPATGATLLQAIEAL